MNQFVSIVVPTMHISEYRLGNYEYPVVTNAGIKVN